MKIKLRTFDGRSHEIEVSKLATVASIKETIKDEFNIEIPKQRLFYRGKQLEDQHTMYDYSVNQEDVIQVMERAVLQPAFKSDSDKSQSEENKDSAVLESEENKLEDQITSPYFKVGDFVYCRDARSGAWNDGKIQAILKNDSQADGQSSSQEDDKEDKENLTDDNLLYKVKLDLPSDEGDTELTVSLNNIRLCTLKSTKLEDVKPGMNFIANINLDRKNEPGNWFEIKVMKTKITRTGGELWADILMGESVLENYRVVFCHDLYTIEPHTKVADRDNKAQEEAMCLEEPCGRCKGNPQIKCKVCNCVKCGGKDNPGEQILCDECNEAYHIGCLTPPLEALPTDDNWFCPDCKRDTNEIVKPGEELKKSKKKSKMASSKPVEEGKKVRDWGCGNATVGVPNKCTIVPPDHFGSIPGVEVGTTWQFRVNASESGVHRPPVSGIHGREGHGAYSIVLSGGYEDDVDNGDEFFYTGSGGRDLSGNKRVAEQSSDQQLTNMNLALARNCNTPVNKNGASASDWKGGKPVRVLRGYKLAKHSEYAPKVGIRYDGIYKVVKYYPEKGKSGFVVWRYVLKRDDPTPAPWTPKGKKFIEEHGLDKIIGAKTEEELNKAKAGKKRKANDAIEDEAPAKKMKTKVKAHELDDKMSKLVKSDANTKIWKDTLSYLEQGKLVFMEKVRENFTCVCCQELVSKPVTTPCTHNMCQACLKRSFAASVFQCPCCRKELGKDYKLTVNDSLSEILITLFPGYNYNR